MLICLTFADKLYAENMSEDGKHPSKEYMECLIRDELSVSYFALEMEYSKQGAEWRIYYALPLDKEEACLQLFL